MATNGIEVSDLPRYDRVRVLQLAPSISDIQLIDQDGRPFRLSQLRNKVTLIFFGFTNCPDVCPMALRKLRQLEEYIGTDTAEIAYVMISVDGERDTPDVMKPYLERYSPRFIGLTGLPGVVKMIAKKFSAAFFKGNATGKSGTYAVSYSPQVFLVDRHGRLRAEFYNATIEAMSGSALALVNEDKLPHTTNLQSVPLPRSTRCPRRKY